MGALAPPPPLGSGSSAASARKVSPPELDGMLLDIVQQLSDVPKTIDELLVSSGSSLPELLNALTVLELEGHVRQLQGQMFVRVSLSS